MKDCGNWLDLTSYLVSALEIARLFKYKGILNYSSAIAGTSFERCLFFYHLR